MTDALPRFEFFDHTADAGLCLYAANPEGLIDIGAKGLYTLIGELVPAGEPKRTWIELAGSTRALLLRDYLTELLVLFETAQRMVTGASVAVFTQTRLRVETTSEAVDVERSVLDREVKAITYHELALEATGDGVEATLIVDI